MKSTHCQILVIGSGLAGLAFALKAVQEHPETKVLIATKDKILSANTSWAQGGIAAVFSDEDSFDKHISDTLHAGAGLCHLDTVQNYVTQAPDRIRDLINWGVQFDVSENSQKIDLTREGGHQSRRILHVADHTGTEIHKALLTKCQQHSQIEIREQLFAIDLISSKQVYPQSVVATKCLGSYFLNRETGEVEAIMADSTVLSTGGAGKVYLYTSNWSGATGDGIAMAYRAGARIANLEFMQFHPTCLYHQQSRNFLISEALRGEGGELIDKNGNAFMKKYHPMGSLAPRDIVARSIDAEMKKTGAECVYLDMTKIPRAELEHRFPVIFAKCLEYGIDMSVQPIPVVPAAHYLCGGILTDVNGKTDIESLWALGETACTGLHGANRLASNSLLECLTMAHNCCQELFKSGTPEVPQVQAPEWIMPTDRDADEMIVITHMWEEIRRLMWNYVGIVRSNKRLERASHRLQNIQSEVREYYSNMQLHPDILELRNIALVADLSVKCALKRKESRGIHFNLDYPAKDWSDLDFTNGNAKDTILWSGSK